MHRKSVENCPSQTLSKGKKGVAGSAISGTHNGAARCDATQSLVRVTVVSDSTHLKARARYLDKKQQFSFQCTR